jgi:hypothetical protein
MQPRHAGGVMSAPLFPDRMQYRAVLADLAAKAKETLPADSAGRIDSAVKMVLAGDVELLADGHALVGSASDPTRTYGVNGTCECADVARAPAEWCKHRIARALAIRLTRELVPQAPPVETPPAPAPPQPLYEAPSSVNCHIMVEGRQVQLTLRDSDEGRLLERLATVLRQYPAEPAQSDRKGIKTSGETSDQGWCRAHQVPMTQSHKNGRSWYSHRTDQGWCKGR